MRGNWIGNWIRSKIWVPGPRLMGGVDSTLKIHWLVMVGHHAEFSSSSDNCWTVEIAGMKNFGVLWTHSLKIRGVQQIRDEMSLQYYMNIQSIILIVRISWSFRAALNLAVFPSFKCSECTRWPAGRCHGVEWINWCNSMRILATCCWNHIAYQANWWSKVSE